MTGLREFLSKCGGTDQEEGDLTQEGVREWLDACLKAPQTPIVACPCGLFHNVKPSEDRYVCPACGATVLVMKEPHDRPL